MLSNKLFQRIFLILFIFVVGISFGVAQSSADWLMLQK
jgi:hypothetical protein